MKKYTINLVRQRIKFINRLYKKLKILNIDNVSDYKRFIDGNDNLPIHYYMVKSTCRRTRCLLSNKHLIMIIMLKKIDFRRS